jgi:anti-sigma factor RsiW
MNFPSPHVSFEQLTDLVEGRAPADEWANLHRHLAACPRCAADLAWLKRAISLMRSDEAQDTPPGVIARALRLFQARAEQAASTPGLRERVLALLRFDSAWRPLAPGLRAGQTAARLLLFRAGPRELDVRLTRAGDAWIVSGQVLGPETSGKVELRGADSRVHAALNDLSEFTLPPVPAGHYALLLHLVEAEIEVTDLEVGLT